MRSPLYALGILLISCCTTVQAALHEREPIMQYSTILLEHRTFIYDDVLDVSWILNPGVIAQEDALDMFAIVEATELMFSVVASVHGGAESPSLRAPTVFEYQSLFYDTLRNSEADFTESGGRFLNTGPFQNVAQGLFWADPNPDYSFGEELPLVNAFDTRTGKAVSIPWDKETKGYIWMLAEGDVSSLADVPLPGAVWLFISAIAGVGLIQRKKTGDSFNRILQ